MPELPSAEPRLSLKTPATKVKPDGTTSPCMEVDSIFFPACFVFCFSAIPLIYRMFG
jgi:hypothetical protein